MKRLLGIKSFVFALLMLGVGVSLGLAQLASAQSRKATPTVLSFLHHAHPDGHALLLLLANPGPTPVPNTPLNDLGQGTYTRDGESEEGGLYPDGSNQRPMDHDIAGQAIAAAITPRGPDGSPTPPNKGGK